MSMEYSKIRENVLVIERLQLMKAKTGVCPWQELCEFLTQAESNELDSQGLSDNAKKQMELASADFVSRISKILDTEVGDRMKNIDAVPDVHHLG